LSSEHKAHNPKPKTMAILAVNPNRMELLRLRKRVVLAQKGHKLLRDKQEELMRRFMALIHECKSLRNKIEEELKKAMDGFLSARSIMSENELDAALSYPKKSLLIESKVVKVLNISVPKIEIKEKPDYHCYGFLNTTDSLDRSLRILSDVIEKQVRLSELELTIAVFAQEIEKTRRRVNALEFILIPNLLETIRFITQKLTEIERSNLTRLMRVKELVQNR